MKEIGIEQFWIEIVEECSDEGAMHKREIEIIKDLGTICPNGYNLRSKVIGQIPHG